MRRMVICENIAQAYQSRNAAEDWSKWASDNPGLAAILNQALRATDGE